MAIFSRFPTRSSPATHHRNEEGNLRVHTLVWLRWFALTGQALTVLLVHYYMEYEFPFLACLGIILISMVINIILKYSFSASSRMKPPHVLLTLSFDVIQLSILLYLTGGMQNPFAFFLLIPIIIAATTQPAFVTIILELISLLAATILVKFHLGLPWTPGESPNLPPVYVYGEWAAIVIGMLFVGLYAWRISRETRQMSNALAATEMVLARVQKLSALDGLAAAAAHELGTPLATITLVSSELLNEVEEDNPIIHDLRLLNEQARRCRHILAQLTQNKSGTDDVLKKLTVTQIVDEVVKGLLSHTKKITIEGRLAPGTEQIGEYSREPVLVRNPGIIYSLGNIISNAQDFARTEVKVICEWTRKEVRIIVQDDGPGINPDIIDRLGEPYVTTRPAGKFDQRDPAEGIGMGLGFFIAKTLLERSGARVKISNSKERDKGAIVSVTWNREEVDIALQEFKKSTDEYYFPDGPPQQMASQSNITF